MELFEFRKTDVQQITMSTTVNTHIYTHIRNNIHYTDIYVCVYFSPISFCVYETDECTNNFKTKESHKYVTKSRYEYINKVRSPFVLFAVWKNKHFAAEYYNFFFLSFVTTIGAIAFFSLVSRDFQKLPIITRYCKIPSNSENRALGNSVVAVDVCSDHPTQHLRHTAT